MNVYGHFTQQIKRRIDAKGKADKFTTRNAYMLIIKVKKCSHIGQLERILIKTSKFAASDAIIYTTNSPADHST